MQIKTFLSLVLGLVCLGCRQEKPPLSTFMVPHAGFCEADFDTTWNSAKNVLRKHDFRLDETDVRTGRITTFPVGSQHFLEFWRDDVATGRDMWESTVNKIRRQVTVEVGAAPGDIGSRIVVVVRKQRFSTPERQITNTAAAQYFLSRSLPTGVTGRTFSSENDVWIDLGRDAAMEDLLRKRIVAVANVSDGNGSPDS